jgi:hypothetical protein
MRIAHVAIILTVASRASADRSIEIDRAMAKWAAGDQVLKRGSETMKTGAKVTTHPWTPPDAGVAK